MGEEQRGKMGASPSHLEGECLREALIQLEKNSMQMREEGRALSTKSLESTS